MLNTYGDIKIGAYVTAETKRRADLYHAITGMSLKAIYEEAIKEYLEKRLPKTEALYGCMPSEAL